MLLGRHCLATTISQKRQAARAEYERSLINLPNDRQLLSTFAAFMEQVMFDESKASEFRQLAEDAAEEKRQRIMRGTKPKQDHGSNAAKAATLLP